MHGAGNCNVYYSSWRVFLMCLIDFSYMVVFTQLAIELKIKLLKFNHQIWEEIVTDLNFCHFLRLLIKNYIQLEAGSHPAFHPLQVLSSHTLEKPKVRTFSSCFACCSLEHCVVLSSARQDFSIKGYQPPKLYSALAINYLE